MVIIRTAFILNVKLRYTSGCAILRADTLDFFVGGSFYLRGNSNNREI